VKITTCVIEGDLGEVTWSRRGDAASVVTEGCGGGGAGESERRVSSFSY